MFKKLFGFGKTSTKTQDPMAVRLGIDTEMCYCPSCGDEYRADIRQCAGCKVALISGEEKLKEARRTIEDFEGRSMEISPDDERVVIRTGKLRDLKPCQILLAKERIPALITGDTGGCAKG